MVNTTDCSRMSRIEAWNFMKKLSDGNAVIVVKQKTENGAVSTTCANGATLKSCGQETTVEKVAEAGQVEMKKI